MQRVVLRFKVKHLLVVVLLLAVSSLGIAQVSQNVLFNEALQADEAGDRERALVLYDRFLARCLDCPQRPEALYRSAEAMARDIPATIMITTDHLRAWVQDNPDADADPVMSAEERYREIIDKYPNSPWAIDAARGLVLQLKKERRWEEAEEIILWALRQPEERLGSMQVQFLKDRIYVANGLRNFDRAVALAGEYSEEFPEITRSYVYLIIGDAHLEHGEIDQAASMYDQARQALLEERRGHIVQPGDSPSGEWLVTEDALSLREEWLASARRLYRENGGSVTGRIEGAGDVASGVDIVIARTEDFGTRVLPSMGNYRVARTDSNGRFAIHDLPPGRYTLGLRFDVTAETLRRAEYAGPSPLVIEGTESVEAVFRIARPVLLAEGDMVVQVEGDRLIVTWSPVEGAERYSVNIATIERTEGGNSLITDRAYTTDRTEIQIDLEDLRWSRPPHGYVNTAKFHLLGRIYPGSENYVYIQAHDAYGVIGTTQVSPDGRWTGEHDVFSIGTVNELTLGERLILENRYDEAIEELERQFSSTQDETAGLILQRLYAYGTDRSGTHQDPLRSVEIGEQLLSMGVPIQWLTTSFAMDIGLLDVRQGVFPGGLDNICEFASMVGRNAADASVPYLEEMLAADPTNREVAWALYFQYLKGSHAGSDRAEYYDAQAEELVPHLLSLGYSQRDLESAQRSLQENSVLLVTDGVRTPVQCDVK